MREAHETICKSWICTGSSVTPSCCLSGHVMCYWRKWKIRYQEPGAMNNSTSNELIKYIFISRDRVPPPPCILTILWGCSSWGSETGSRPISKFHDKGGGIWTWVSLVLLQYSNYYATLALVLPMCSVLNFMFGWEYPTDFLLRRRVTVTQCSEDGGYWILQPCWLILKILILIMLL